MSCSASAGMPGRPSAVETMPACIDPPPSVGSSQCCMSRRRTFWQYCSALRMTDASATPTPSSLKAIAPRCEHRADLGQFLALAALGDRADRDRHWPARPAAPRGRMNSICPSLSSGGLVLGMQQTVVNPPATAAADAAGDGLFLLIARLAEMDVNVDQAGRDVTAGGVDHAIGAAEIGCRCRRSCRRESADPPAARASARDRGSCRFG